MTPRALLLLPVIATWCAPSCSDVDACERTWPSEHEFNELTEGEQAVSGSAAIGPLPQGGALLVFRSQAQVASAAEQHVLRGVALDSGGAPLNTCQSNGEVTYTPAEPMADVKNSLPSLAPPADENATGLLSYVRYSPRETSMQIMGLQLRASGCPANEKGPELISAEPTGSLCDVCENCKPEEQPDIHCATEPTTVRFENGDFGVFWMSTHYSRTSLRSVVRARVLRPDFLGLQPQPTVSDRSGEPTELVELGISVSDIAARSLSGDLFALAWQQNLLDGAFETQLQLYNSLLEPTTDPILLDSAKNGLPDATEIQLAVRGNRMLVVWIARADDETPRAFARVIKTDGSRLLYPKERPTSFRLSQSDCGPEGDVTVTPMNSTRAAFLVAWRSAGCDESGTSIRAAIFDENGLPVFGNRACNPSDFTLVTAGRGDQEHIALTTTTNGSVAAAWTDRGMNGGDGRHGSDRSGAAVRGVMLERTALIPESQ